MQMFTMNDLFEIAIKMEKNGEAVYSNAAEKIKNSELKSLLEWMADEEASHARWFLNKKNTLSMGKEEARLKEMVPQGLQDMMGEKTLSLNEVDFNKIKTVSGLMETFTGFENDTILFYELLEMFIEDKTVLNGLKQIILEEKKHVEKLRSMQNSCTENLTADK